VWSNGAVADDDPDDASPWTRDDWVPESTAPDPVVFGAKRSTPGSTPARGPGSGSGGGAPPDPLATGEPPPEDFDDHSRHAVAPRSTVGRKVVAGGVVVALLVGSAGALLRDDSQAESEPETTTGDLGTDLGVRAPEPTSPDTIPPTSVRTVTVPVSPEPGIIEIADPPPPIVEGEVPPWAERTINVPDALASMAPTEVVTLSQSGVLSVTEFPSGRSRSIDVSDIGSELQLAVGDGTIVVFDSTTLVQIRDREPVVKSELLDGIIFVQPWTGTGNFVVTTPTTGPRAPEQDWVLRPDSNLELLDSRFTDETSFFARVFSPFGDALFTAPGGVYAVAPDGAVRRISTGALLATGSRHWAIEECDDALRCAYSIIEWDSGTVTPGVLDAIDGFGFLDPSTHISPDGRSIVYRADADGSGRRQILDVATGGSIQAGRINQLVYPDSWVSDSSGLFFADRFLQFVDRTNGTVTEIADLDRVRTVAVTTFSK
jgi:hypothetical protein